MRKEEGETEGTIRTGGNEIVIKKPMRKEETTELRRLKRKNLRTDVAQMRQQKAAQAALKKTTFKSLRARGARPARAKPARGGARGGAARGGSKKTLPATTQTPPQPPPGLNKKVI